VPRLARRRLQEVSLMSSLLTRSQSSILVPLVGILSLAAILRLGAMRSEFWLDEIWSWEFARSASTPWEIFIGADQHHDNNHKLNTLFLWLYPSGLHWEAYRLHSLAAGLASVLIAALLGLRRGRAEALIAALLFAVNYWLVLCSAEARGYALAVLFALTALYTLQAYLTAAPSAGRRIQLVLFWFSVILGFLAHLTFLHCYLALGVWSVYFGARSGLSRRDEIRQLLACHLVPCLFFVALYWFDIRRMKLGGGPAQPTFLVFGRLLGLGLGFTPSAVARWLAVIFAALTLVLGLRRLAHENQRLGLFFAAAIVGSPALFLLGKPAYLFERYFLISFVFLLLLLAFVLGSLWRSSRAGACFAGLITLALSCGGTAQVLAFERDGRGHFLDALACIERLSPNEGAIVCGDFDFRVAKCYRFYIPYLRTEKQLVYCEQEKLPPQGADWLLVHRIDSGYPLHEQMTDKYDNVYRRVENFAAADFGGWNWHVYRNERSKRAN
jgi:hypothetical protein